MEENLQCWVSSRAIQMQVGNVYSFRNRWKNTLRYCDMILEVGAKQLVEKVIKRRLGNIHSFSGQIWRQIYHVGPLPGDSYESVYSFHSVGYNFETTAPDVGELLRRGCHHHRCRKYLEKLQVSN